MLNNSAPTPCDDGQLSNSTSSATSTPRTAEDSINIIRKRRAAGKSRRVRTGCLTCRGRHLKCDEAVGRCENCRKSDRICRRGIRLNFIDTQTVAPPRYAIRKAGARLVFRDESRHIASKYVGGSESYPTPDLNHQSEYDQSSELDLFGSFDFSTTFNPPFADPDLGGIDILTNDTFCSTVPDHGTFHIPCASTEHLTASIDSGPYISDPDDLRLVQLFTEDIGPWMDSVDVSKYFTHILPFQAIGNSMLLNALRACGARRLHGMIRKHGEEKASYLYDMTSRNLLDCLQDPGRDSALCATTAIILSVYEVLSPRDPRSINHVAGTRALIKECGWDANTSGLGGACFWLNITIELLTCLRSNCHRTWDFDSWNVNMNMDELQPYVAGNEELWTRRMIYICAKIANHRSSMSQFQALNYKSDASQINHRCQEWDLYKKWCDQWASTVPRSIKPLAYINPSQSAFPVIWLTRPHAIIAQLFYHTAQILLCKTYPITSEHNIEMRSLQQSHASDICGIIAHIKSLSIARLSIPFLVFAAECLTVRDVQEQALEIVNHILASEDGWSWRGQSQSIEQKIQQAWDWTNHQQTSTITTSLLTDKQQGVFCPGRSRMTSGDTNPLAVIADFAMQNHPYQAYYVPPSRSIGHYQYAGF